MNKNLKKVSDKQNYQATRDKIGVAQNAYPALHKVSVEESTLEVEAGG